TATELHHISVAFIRHDGVEHPLDLGHRVVLANVRISEARRAAQITGFRHLDKRQTCMLFVVSAEAAVEWATLFHLRLKSPGQGPWLVVLALAQVVFRV